MKLKKASRQRGVCVEHLKRCKTSCGSNLVEFRIFAVTSYVQGGQWISFHPLPSEDGGLRLWYRDWSSRRTCNFPICQFSFCRQWQPAKPRTGTSIISAWGLPTALLSQSGFIWLFTTGSATSEHSSEQGRRKVTSHWHSRWINQFFLADFKGLFSARVMHSTTKFAMLFLSKCVIPAVYVKLAGTLRGKPFQANNWQ